MKDFDFGKLWVPDLHPAEVVLRATIVYLFAQLAFRVAGRKALQRWGMPEIALLFLVTVALRRAIVVDDASVTTAMVALATILVLDRTLTYVTYRWGRGADAIEGAVRRLVRDGVLDRAELAKARISEDELLSRVRARGHERLDDIKDAFFERSGEITIVFRS